MESLIIKQGGFLSKTKWVYDEEKGIGTYITTDVTDHAINYLMDEVQFADDVRLVDIFLLLRTDDTFSKLFRRDWAKEYLAAAFKEGATEYTGQYDPNGIEYLEIYQVWEKNSVSGEMSGINYFGFHGIGYHLIEDVMQDDRVMHPKNTRVHWGLICTHLSTLLNIPLRFNQDVNICESNYDNAEQYGKVIDTVIIPFPLLSQVIHGILWELSFYGGPEATAIFHDELLMTVHQVHDDNS